MTEEEGRVLAVHFGRSANCSSVGSVVDVLFVSSVVGTALVGAVTVLLRRRRAEKEEAAAGATEDGDARREGEG